MEHTYQLQSPPFDNVLKRSDGAFVPVDQCNRDYQEYLEWLARGNAPLPPPTED